MLSRIRKQIFSFTSSRKDYPIIAGLASGLFPFIHYYSSNFIRFNSWQHLFYFALTFLLLPSTVFFFFHRILKSNYSFYKYLIPILNLSVFGLFIVWGIYGMKKKILLITLVFAFFLAFLLYRHIKKIIVFQFLLATIAFLMFIPKLFIYLEYDDEWMTQPDDIEEVVFKKQPNIYLIQPDGYANLLELKTGNYNFDNSKFELFLKNKGFTIYDNYRSNYGYTLYSNSSMFSMKHHYYKNPIKNGNDLYDFRKVIIEKNPVISIFNANNYKTHLILEEPYILLNMPKMGYDYCNIDYNTIPYMSRGFDMGMDILNEMETLINTNKVTNNFYFIEKLIPGHIRVNSLFSKGVEKERKYYLERLKKSNEWLNELVEIITQNDPNGIILIASDHGGYVGFKNTDQSLIKTHDRVLINSIFSSILAIKWSYNQVPEFENELKSPINLFRFIFSYLSENDKYLKFLQED
ncbi:MAG TPA: hypothetical protein VGA80_16750, partial [Flavobacteriaceae bacterium]